MSANPALDRDEVELFIVDAGEVVAAEPAVEAMEEEPSLFTNVEQAVEEAAPSDVELVDRSAAVDALSADAPRADATADALSSDAPAREAEEAPLVGDGDRNLEEFYEDVRLGEGRSFPTLAEERAKDPEDPGRIYWDMAFVFPAEPKKRKSMLQELGGGGGDDKKSRFDYKKFVNRAAEVGLVTSSYLSIQKDEIFVRVGATHARLAEQADNIDFVMPLNEKRLEAIARPGNPARHIAPIDIPDKTPEKEGGAAISRFRAFEHMYGKFDTTHHLTPVYERTNGHLFSSMQRLKLVWACLTADKSLGGAAIPVDKRVKQGDVLAALAMHDEEERLALYASFVRAPWSTPPTSLPIDAFKDYFGEKQALLMRFMGHVTNGYMGMALVGVVVQIRVFVAADSRPAVELAGVYSLILCLWSVFQTEYWKRTERETALLWGTVGFEDQELVRPQFKGIRMLDPVTGRRGVFFPPAKRSARVAASFFATFACIAGNLAFLFACVVMKGGFHGLYASNPTMALAGTVLNAVGIQAFAIGYQEVAIKLTDAENWMTDTVYADKLIGKLTAFNFVNSYFALFFAIFLNKHCGAAVGSTASASDACFADLRFNLVVIFFVALVSGNVTNFAVPYAKLLWNMYNEGAWHPRGLGEVKEMSVPGICYLLVEPDEVLDSLKAYTQQATQYGYITIFSAAFPGAPILAFLNNAVQMRVDAFKFLTTYRRVQPHSAEDIGTFQTIFEALNIVGAISNAAILVYRTNILGGHQISKHAKDIIFMLTVAAFVAVIGFLQVVIDDVPFDVDLQIQRNEFVKSKVIDLIADEEDAANQKAEVAGHDVRDKDALEPYTTYRKTIDGK